MQYAMLSLLKDYQCSLCAQCCHDWNIEVTPEEISRVEAGLATIPKAVIPKYSFDEFQEADSVAPSYYFKMFDNHCGFLQDDNKCFLHCQFGPDIKPSICVSYPIYAIATPEITYFNTSFSCMTICRLLQRTWNPYIQELATPLPRIHSLREVESQGVRLEQNQIINWPTFYFLQPRLFSYPGYELPLFLDSFWQQIKSYPYQYLGIPELHEILEKPMDTTSRPDPIAHLQLMSRTLRIMVDYNFEPELFFPPCHLLSRLGIGKHQPSTRATSRYHRLFRDSKLDKNPILNNYLRARLFISDWYFSHSIADTIALVSLATGLASLLALSAAGTEPLEDEHLLQGIFAVEKYLFHSEVTMHIDLGEIRPKVAFGPL